MGRYQRELNRVFERLPRSIVVDVLSDKLKQREIDVPRSEVERAYDDLIQNKIAYIDMGSGSPTDIEEIFGDEEMEEIRKRWDRLEGKLPETITKIVEDSSNSILKDIWEFWPFHEIEEEAENVGFKLRLRHTWKRGILNLRAMLWYSRQIGSDRQRLFKRDRAPRWKYRRAAFLGLHIRACQVFDEILCLMENGFADGAMARWRTLYEISVVADFLNSHDEDTAVRYLAHDIVEEKRGLDEYLRAHKDLGQRKPTKPEIDFVNSRFEAALSSYGVDFAGPYGWAAKSLGKSRPRFLHIEEATDRTRMRPYYKMASHNVHAGTMGMIFKHGHVDNWSGPLAGASNAGLLDPGQNSAYSMCQITSYLFGPRLTVDEMIPMSVMAKLRDGAEKNLYLADKKMRAEESVQLARLLAEEKL